DLSASSAARERLFQVSRRFRGSRPAPWTRAVDLPERGEAPRPIWSKTSRRGGRAGKESAPEATSVATAPRANRNGPLSVRLLAPDRNMANIFIQPCDEGVVRARPAGFPCAPVSEPWVLAATILGSSMVFIDGTVVNVALPALQKSFDATVLDVQWVVESYALFLAALLLAGGAIGDRYGRRRVFCSGVALFALASIGGGMARSVNQLIVARAAQGVAAALLVPGSLAIISASFDEQRRGQAIGTWSGFTAITAGAGPVVGGWLIEHVSWRAVFFINAPLALIVLLI